MLLTLLRLNLPAPALCLQADGTLRFVTNVQGTDLKVCLQADGSWAAKTSPGAGDKVLAVEAGTERVLAGGWG